MKKLIPGFSGNLAVLGWLVAVLPTVLNAVATNPAVPWNGLPNVSLPTSGFVDMETVTNMPMPNLTRQTGRFAFSLGCLATPTNNVEVAFGTDENANGALEPEEIDVVVGWDAGRWCVERDFVTVASSTGGAAVGSVQTLTWVLDVDSNGAPVGLDARVDGTPLFPQLSAQPPVWLHKTGWNMMRLTGRGIARHEDSFRFGFVGADGALLQREKLKGENEKLNGDVGASPNHVSSILHSSTVSDDDIAAGWRLEAVGGAEAGFAALRPVNAVVHEPWRLRGAHIDGFRIPAVDWMFRSMHEGYLDAVTVCSWGEIRPHIATNYFPRPFPEADLSLLPLAKWGLLPPDAEESLFWHATTPSNSLMLTWRNAAYGRDANCPTNFQAEIFPDGGFVYRYEDRTERYVAVSPWDWDGDGLENSVDPDPKLAGPDAHGTNAEWYSTVCSNVFAQIGQSKNPNNRTILLPNGEPVCFKSGVNTNAYYFVDVVAADGPAPVYFNADRSSRLGSPVVMALAGATNHVPLLIGVEYAVTSPAPFTVSVPTNGFAAVVANNGSSSAFTVKWPLEFVFTEAVSGTGRSYTVGVEPYNPGGVFTWGGASLQSVSLPGGEGACGCVSGLGNIVTFGCSSTCNCGGRCRARGWYQFELASFVVEGGECRCGFDDPSASGQPTFGPLDVPTIAVEFSAPAVIYEDAYVESFDPTQGTSVVQPRRSTRTRLTVSAWGGPNGGTLDITSQNLGKLAPVACGPMLLPSSVTLNPYQQWSVSYLCEGGEASVEENDITVCGTFTDGVSGVVITNRAELMSFSVCISPEVEAPENRSNFRHKFGVGERMNFRQSPIVPSLFLSVIGGLENLNLDGDDDGIRYVIWSFRDETHSLEVRWNGVGYRPLVSVVCPSGIKTRNVHWETNGLPPGVAGGICLVQQFLVKPLDVSFSSLSIEEVPCFDEIPPVGYYASVTGRWAKSHTEAAGAGRWLQVSLQDNCIGGVMYGDSAGSLEEIPRVDSEGHETDDPNFGWRYGSMTWKIPFGWQSSHYVWPMSALPLGTFAEDTRQTFTVSAYGDYKIRKLKNEVERKIDGSIYLRKGVE